MHGFLNIDALEENYRRCRRYTRHYAKSFYFSSHVLPREKRHASYAVYAFCRYADEVADVAASMTGPLYAKKHLDELRNQLRYVYSSSPLMDEKLQAFRDTVLRYRIPQEYFTDLLRGVETDLTTVTMPTFRELKEYCYGVASVVGLMMTRIFGTTNDEAYRYAQDLGTAMQLTNILRDVGEDLERGRVYLPREEMEHFGYSPEDLASQVNNDAFRALMQFQIERARGYYRSAEQGIPLLKGRSSRFCVRLMSRIYSRILDAIERNDYDVFTRRAYVPVRKKLFLMLGAAFDSRAAELKTRNLKGTSLALQPAEQH